MDNILKIDAAEALRKSDAARKAQEECNAILYKAYKEILAACAVGEYKVIISSPAKYMDRLQVEKAAGHLRSRGYTVNLLESEGNRARLGISWRHVQHDGK